MNHTNRKAFLDEYGMSVKSERRTTGAPLLILLAHVMATFFAAMLIWASTTSGPVTAGDVTFSCVVATALFGWMVWSWHVINGSIFDPYGLFLLLAVLFNGGQVVLEALRLNPVTMLNGVFSNELLFRTVLYVAFGISALHLGAVVAHIKKSPFVDGGNADGESVRTVGWLLLAISLVPSLLLLTDALTVVMSSGYMGLYQRTAATGAEATPQILAGFLAPAAVFLLAGSKGSRVGRVVSGVTVISYSLILVFLGYRLNAFLPALAYLWVWHRCIRPISKEFLIILSSILLFVVFPVIRTVRTISGSERASLDFLVNAFQSLSHPIVDAFFEMGGSMRTVAYTMQLVPSTRVFDLGSSYGYAILSVMPNLFWAIHPSIAHGTASHWLVWTVDPFTAALGGGFGYSFLAEAYLNFGAWFGLVFLTVTGFVIARCARWTQISNDPARVAAVAAALAFFLRFPRDESVSVFRPLIWNAAVPFLLTWALRILARKRGATRRELGDGA